MKGKIYLLDSMTDDEIEKSFENALKGPEGDSMAIARAMAASIMGKKGGSMKSEKKAAAVRENGKKGGRSKGKKQMPLAD